MPPIYLNNLNSGTKSDYFFKNYYFLTDTMIPTQGSNNPLYSGHLKGNEELYVKNDSLVVIHGRKGNVFSMELQHIRCAYPTSHDTVRIFWRAPKDKSHSPWKYWHRYHYDFKLDLKKSYPEKKQRKIAEKTEAKRLANLLSYAIQNNHNTNTHNTKGYLAMHTGEYLMNSYEGQCKYGQGTMLITNLGIYFVVDHQGLCFDLPLDILDSYNFKNKTVKIHYHEPFWIDGYDKIINHNHKTDFRITSAPAQTVCDAIKKAYSDGGAKEARLLAQYTEKFGSMTRDEIYKEYHAGKYFTWKEIDNYFHILGKRRWGMPTTSEIGEYDNRVVFACMRTGISLDVAGDLTEKDRAMREDSVRYEERFKEHLVLYQPLIFDIMGIMTKNLGPDDTDKVHGDYNTYVLFDVIEELAKNGSVSESFEPASLIEWRQIAKDYSQKLISQNSPDGYNFRWRAEIFCPWSVDDAKRIMADKEYKSLLDAIKSLNEKYSDISPLFNGAQYAKTFEGDLRDEILLRGRRVYDEWCKSHPLSEHTDHTDRSWVQYTIDNLDEDLLEIERERFDFEKTPIDSMRDAEMESKNKKTRLERAIKPKSIPDEDIYVDAWYDKSKHSWFTTNPYFRITEPGIEIMSPDLCDQKFGYRATVFSEDTVELKHGYPAIYDKEAKWWILLSSIEDKFITPEMVDEKCFQHTLKYENVEPQITIANDGSLPLSTEREWFLKSKDDAFQGPLLPLNERIRRMIFREIVSFTVSITDEDKLQQTSLVPA